MEQGGQWVRLPTGSRVGILCASLEEDFKYAGSNTIDDIAWCYGNSGSQTLSGRRSKPTDMVCMI